MIKPDLYRSTAENNEKLLRAIVASLFLFNIVLSIYKIAQSGIHFIDFHARWQECAYFCRGINPFEVDSSNVIQEVGFIHSAMVTVPWAWLLGMVINPGFLPYEIAKCIGIIVYITIYIVTSIILYRYWIKQCGADKKWAVMATSLLGCQIYWWWSFACGNHGAIAACLTIISICIYKKHPIISGILMLFAMIKPQLAAIFFLVFLLEKEFKVIATTFIGGIISCLSVMLITKTSMLTLISQAFAGGSSLEKVFFGLFDVLKFYNISVSIVLMIDVLAGVLYVVIYWVICKKRQIENEFMLFSGVAVASTFWFYKQPHDSIIVAIPCLALLYIGYLNRNKCLKYMLLIVILVGSFYLQGVVQFILKILTPDIMPEMATSLGMSINRMCLMICGFFCLSSNKEKFTREIHSRD